MPDLVQVPVDGGESFLLEVDRRTIRVGRAGDAVDAAHESFQRSLDRVRSIAAVVVEKLSALPQQPDRVRVEFGVKLSGEANVIVTRTTGEAHFVIDMEWTRAGAGQPPRDSGDG